MAGSPCAPWSERPNGNRDPTGILPPGRYAGFCFGQWLRHSADGWADSEPFTTKPKAGETLTRNGLRHDEGQQWRHRRHQRRGSGTTFELISHWSRLKTSTPPRSVNRVQVRVGRPRRRPARRRRRDGARHDPRMLESIGYEVLSTSSAEGSRYSSREGREIQLLISDVIMPEMTAWNAPADPA